MKTKSLARLAEVANLLKFDITPGVTTLVPFPGSTEAWYSGTYTTGVIRVEEETDLTGPRTVPTAEFRELVKLISAPEVTVRGTPSSLILATGLNRLTLRCQDDPMIDRWFLAEPLQVSVDRKSLMREAAIAEDIASKSFATPVLTATHLRYNEGWLTVEALNGVSMAFTSTIEAEGKGEFEVLPPAADLATALKVFEDETVGLAVPERGRSSLLIRDANTTVRMAVLAGKWPDMSRLSVPATDELVVPAATFKQAAQAIRIYDVPHELTLRPRNETRALISSRTGERGGYEALVEGGISQSYTVSSDDLDTVAHAVDGDLHMALSGTRAKVIKKGDPERAFWLNMRFSR